MSVETTTITIRLHGSTVDVEADRSKLEALTFTTLASTTVETVPQNSIFADPYGILDQPLRALGLFAHYREKLEAQGITTVRDLVMLNLTEAMKMISDGRLHDSVKQHLVERLHVYELCFAEMMPYGLLCMPLSFLGLSGTAVTNLLKDSGAKNIGDLVAMTFDEINALPRASRVTVSKITMRLDAFGLSLRETT